MVAPRIERGGIGGVNAEAGRIIHGAGLGVMSHYVDQTRLLADVAPSVRMPLCFLSAEDKKQSARDQAELLDRWRRASDSQRQTLLQVARLTTSAT